jgi:hypothetical protein
MVIGEGIELPNRLVFFWTPKSHQSVGLQNESKAEALDSKITPKRWTPKSNAIKLRADTQVCPYQYPRIQGM